VQPGEADPERPHDGGGRPERRDRELLWVESVSERLLGGQAPRPWERVYFDRDADQVPDSETAEAQSDDAEDGSASGSGEDPSVTSPTTYPTTSEAAPGVAPAEPPSSVQVQPRVLDLSATAPSDDEILSAALQSGDAALAGAVVDLLDSRARDKARIVSLERALRVLLTQVERNPESTTSGASLAAVLHRVLGG
jgi:hypothetical protein